MLTSEKVRPVYGEWESNKGIEYFRNIKSQKVRGLSKAPELSVIIFKNVT